MVFIKRGHKRLVNHYCVRCGRYSNKPLKTISPDNPKRKICPSCKDSIRDKKRNIDTEHTTPQ